MIKMKRLYKDDIPEDILDAGGGLSECLVDRLWRRRVEEARRTRELGDALKMALVAIDALIEARPILAAKMCGTTTLGNVRAEIKAVLNG